MKVLFLYPNKWGRGITPIWLASHNGVLKKMDLRLIFLIVPFFQNNTHPGGNSYYREIGHPDSKKLYNQSTCFLRKTHTNKA